MTAIPEPHKSIAVDFDPQTGLSGDTEPIRRYLSAMAGMYADADAFERALAAEDALVYEFYDMGIAETDGDIAFGTTIIYPGTIGDEYFMTKGHFHTILATAEVYYCIRGRGIMLMEHPGGDCETAVLQPGRAVYVPPKFAHRTINTSPDEPLVCFFAFRADAGHDYGTIETKGFRKLVVARDGGPAVVDNPRWKE